MKSLNGVAAVAAWSALTVGGMAAAEDLNHRVCMGPGVAVTEDWGQVGRRERCSSFEPSNLKSISLSNAGKTVVVINKSGFKRELNVVPYLGGGKTASRVTVSGKYLEITASDGKTVIKWDPQAGKVLR